MVPEASLDNSRRQFLVAGGLTVAAACFAPSYLMAETEGIVVGALKEAATAKVTVQNLRRNISVLLGAGGVCCVALRGQLLVPETDVESRVGRVTIRAGISPGSSDGRFAPRPKVMHAHHVAGNLSRRSDARKQDRQAGQPESEPHFPPPVAPPCSTGFFAATNWNTWTRRLNESTTSTRSLWSINRPAGSWNSPAWVPRAPK